MTMTPEEFRLLIDKLLIYENQITLIDVKAQAVAAYSALYHEVGNLTKDKPTEWHHPNPTAVWQIEDQVLPFIEEES